MTEFLFTSDQASPHHAHHGYGLKKGLEGAEASMVATLEALCFALVAPRKVYQAQIHAHGKKNQIIWETNCSITQGHEKSGRIHFVVTGLTPPLDILKKTCAWSSQINSTVTFDAPQVSAQALQTFIYQRVPQTSLRTVHTPHKSTIDSSTPRSMNTKWILLLCMSVVCILWYVFQLTPFTNTLHQKSQSYDARTDHTSDHPLGESRMLLECLDVTKLKFEALLHPSKVRTMLRNTRDSTYTCLQLVDQLYRSSSENQRQACQAIKMQKCAQDWSEFY